MAQQRFADHQRKAMLKAIHEREGRWNEVDPDTEIASIGEGSGLSEDESFALFGQLVDEGFVDPGRAYRAGGAMPSLGNPIGMRKSAADDDDDAHDDELQRFSKESATLCPGTKRSCDGLWEPGNTSPIKPRRAV